MGNKHPENHDYPASQVWREYYAESRAHPKLKKRETKTIRVAGMTLDYIDPSSTPDETTFPKVEANLKKLGLLPSTKKPPEIPVPAEAKTAKPKSKGGPRKKINPPWHGDSQPAIAIITHDHKRGLALNSDAGHDESVWSRQRRKNLGLPEKAPSFKNLLLAITALTPEDLIIIKDKFGYNPERIHQYAPLTKELILHKLRAYKEWVQKQTIKV